MNEGKEPSRDPIIQFPVQVPQDDLEDLYSLRMLILLEVGPQTGRYKQIIIPKSKYLDACRAIQSICGTHGYKGKSQITGQEVEHVNVITGPDTIHIPDVDAWTDV